MRLLLRHWETPTAPRLMGERDALEFVNWLGKVTPQQEDRVFLTPSGWLYDFETSDDEFTAPGLYRGRNVGT